MARQVDKSTIKKMIDYYENNNVSMQQVADMFDICKGTVFLYMKKNNVKVDAKRSKVGKKVWNSGLTKKTDNRIVKYAKTKSKEYLLDGYKMIWSDILNKSVREHHEVWFKNTDHWPDSKVGEQIHHIDGDKLNNNFKNLVLCLVAEHTEIHKQYEQLTCQLIRLGFIEFNIKNKTLIIDEFIEFIERKRSEDEPSKYKE